MPDVALAFDLGGTRLKAGVVEVGSGEVVFEHEPADAERMWVDAVAQIEELARELRVDHPSAGAVGLAMPGIIDDGRVRSLPGKLAGAEGVDARAWLTRHVAGDGCGAVVVNDAAAAGVGEAGSSAARTVVITLGTGVGVSVVEDGRPLGRGAFGGGTLGGQVALGGVVADARFTDTAGGCGTIEAHCRAEALVVHARLLGGDWLDAKEVIDAAGRGDATASGAVDAYRADVTRAVSALAYAHGPGRIVIGGGVAFPGSPVLRGIEDAVNESLSFGLRVRIEPALLGSRAALAGLGVLLASER